MSILTPAALVLVVLLPVIIVMYLLKLRRKEQIISSTFLWRKIVQDLEANAPWQRLRRNLLLFLQLLFLIFLIIAIARPFTWTEGASGKMLIIILDTSASMGSDDVYPNRLEAAKNQAHHLVEQLPGDGRVTIIDAGEKARLVTPSSNDHKQAHQAIANIQVGTGGSDLGVALQLASAIAMRQPDTQTIVISDGNITLPDRMSLSGDIRYVPIGKSDNNQAIGMLTLHRIPGSGDLGAFAQVINYSDSSTKRRVAFYADGQLANVFDLDLSPNGEEFILVEDLPITTNLVEARLLSDAHTIDFLITDDRALAVHRQTSPISVTLVTRGNLFLETALALLPDLMITTVDSEEVTNLPVGDLTIFDNHNPVTNSLPLGNLLYIAPPQGTQYFTVHGMINTPVPRPAKTGMDANPLIAHVNLEGVNILDAVRIPLPDWSEPLIVTEDPASGMGMIYPLLFYGETDERRIAVMAFDLHHSDLPLQTAFPILLANLVQWLAPEQGGSFPSQVDPGTAITFFIPPGSPSIDQADLIITRPDGTSINLDARASQVVFADTDQLGLYRVDLGRNQSVDFVVNLFSPLESRIEPATSILSELRQSIPGTTSSESITGSQRARKEWWRLCALIALTLLIVEWLVYNRSAIIMFYKRLTLSLKKGTSRIL